MSALLQPRNLSCSSGESQSPATVGSEHQWGTEDTKVRRGLGHLRAFVPSLWLLLCAGTQRGDSWRQPVPPTMAHQGKSTGFTRKGFSSIIWKKSLKKPSQPTDTQETYQRTPNPQNALPGVALLTKGRVNVGLECSKIMNPLTMGSICVSQITFLSLTQPLKAFYRWIPMTQAFIIPSLHKSCC